MVEIINRQRKHPLNRKRIRSLIERLSARCHLGNPEVVLVFVGTRAIRTLNRKYRRKDRPTDVLSFPIGKKGADGKFYLGDIVISVPVAAKQARTGGHSLEHELEVLVLHGFLHLAGYDHGADVGLEEKAARRLFFGDGT
jgi:probable rRNA maturation factor